MCECVYMCSTCVVVEVSGHYWDVEVSALSDTLPLSMLSTTEISLHTIHMYTLYSNTQCLKKTGAVLDRIGTSDHQVSRPVFYQLSHQETNNSTAVLIETHNPHTYMYSTWRVSGCVWRCCTCVWPSRDLAECSNSQMPS